MRRAFLGPAMNVFVGAPDDRLAFEEPSIWVVCPVENRGTCSVMRTSHICTLFLVFATHHMNLSLVTFWLKDVGNELSDLNRYLVRLL